jgi:transcriptional regulator with XRE-family HTH domain
MIGLEFICNMHSISIKQLADVTGIKPPTIFKWISGDRKIPKERIIQLMGIEQFKGVHKEYFQKELNNSDKIYILEQEIQRLKSC